MRYWPSVSEAQVLQVRFKLWSAAKSATKEILNMRSILNQPINASGPCKGREALTGWLKVDCMFRIPLVADFATDHSLKRTWRTWASLFPEEMWRMKPNLGHDMAKYVVNGKPWKKVRIVQILRQFRCEVAPHSGRRRRLACLVLLLSSTGLRPSARNNKLARERFLRLGLAKKKNHHAWLNQHFPETLFQHKGKRRLYCLYY